MKLRAQTGEGPPNANNRGNRPLPGIPMETWLEKLPTSQGSFGDSKCRGQVEQDLLIEYGMDHMIHAYPS